MNGGGVFVGRAALRRAWDVSAVPGDAQAPETLIGHRKQLLTVHAQRESADRANVVTSNWLPGATTVLTPEDAAPAARERHVHAVRLLRVVG